MDSDAGQRHSPRLVVYIVADCSGGMLRQMPTVRQCVSVIAQTPLLDPRSAETVYIRVIPFNDDAQPGSLRPLSQFVAPPLEALGKTQLGRALQAVNAALDADLVAPSVRPDGARLPGDFRPIVFLITDGIPSSPENLEWRPEAERLRERRRHRPWRIVGLAVGPKADLDTLNAIADKTIVVGDTTRLEQDLMEVFDWVPEPDSEADCS